MTLESLPVIVTLLIALSVASERAVEILKGLVPWLDAARPDAKGEGRRRAALQGLAAVSGILVSYLTWPVIRQIMIKSSDNTRPDVHWPTVLALGLLASGGSGFWNSILSYVVNLKELKAADLQQRTASAEAAIVPRPTEGRLHP